MDKDTLKEKWNNFASKNGISKVAIISPSRLKKFNMRVKEGMVIDDVLEAASEQGFLLGDNERRWKMDFDWIVSNDTNYIKILEYKYGQKKYERML